MASLLLDVLHSLKARNGQKSPVFTRFIFRKKSISIIDFFKVAQKRSKFLPIQKLNQTQLKFSNAQKKYIFVIFEFIKSKRNAKMLYILNFRLALP